MAEFTFGLNIKTLLLIFCIILSACVIVTIGYFMGKQLCNKKSDGITSTKSLKEEETLWTSVEYDTLKDQINLVILEEVKTVEKFSHSPDSPDSKDFLLECVTNKFTLQYNDPKLMKDSNFNSKVKRLITDCKQSIIEKKKDPSYPDPDPGPPVWSSSAIKKFKSSIKQLLNDRSPQPNEEQFNCIVKKLLARFKTPRDMIKLKYDESLSLLEKTMKVCGYNQESKVVVGNTIIWNNPENLLKLKAKIILVDSSILDTEGLLSCVARKISENITDPNSINDVMINQYKEYICTMGQLKTSTLKLSDKVIVGGYFINKFKEMKGRNPTEEEKGSIISRCEKIFETIEEFKNLKDTTGLIDTFIQIILRKSISLTTSVDLWTQSEK